MSETTKVQRHQEGKRELPEGWHWTVFSEVISKVTPQTRKLKVTEYQRNGKYPIIDQGQKQIVGYTDDESLLITEPLPLIVFGDHTKTAKYIDCPFVLGADGVVLLSAKADIDSQFFYYWLRQVRLQNLGYARHFGVLKNQNIPLPSFVEQRRIAGVLRVQMAAVENARASAQARLAAVKALPAAFLRQVFPQPGQPLPDGWRWVKLGEVCRDISDGTHFTPTYVSEGVPFLSVKDVRENRLSFADCRYITEEQHHDLCRRCKPEKGDVLYTKVGTTGIAKAIDIDIEFSIFVSVALLKIQSTITPHYLEKVLNAPVCRTQAENLTQGMANRNLVLKDLKLIMLPLPPLAEQQRIAGVLKEQMAAVDKTRTAAEEELDTINTLPAALLRQAFNGEI